jgi:hypothetical protein
VLERADYHYSIDPAEIFASPKGSFTVNATLRTASRTSVGSARFEWVAPLSRGEPAIQQCRCDGSSAAVTVARPATQASIISTTSARAAFLAGALHCDVCSDEITADYDIRALTREQPGVGAPMSA